MQTAKQNNSIYKKYIVLHTLMCVLLSVGTFSPLSQMATISIILIVLVELYEPVEQSLYLIIMLAPFENLISLNGRKVFFIVFFVFLMKVLIKKAVIRGKNNTCLLFAVALVGLEIFNEFMLPAVSTSPYALLNVSFYILFFFCVIHSADDIGFSLKTAILSFNISILIVIVATFNSYGSFVAFMEKARQASYVFRLGNTTFDTLGGAMGIPLYASLVLAFNVVYLTINKVKSIISDIYLFLMIAISVAFGVLSVSRAFYLCFIAFFGLYIVINLFQKKKYGFAVFVSILAILAIVIFLTSDDYTWILGNLTSRMNEDAGVGIRGQIWMSCLEFLFKHPGRLLLGLSSNCYDQYGVVINQLFSWTAHNFVLDIIMSFGLVGFSMLIYMFRHLLRILRDRFGTIEATITILPFITFMVFGLTALRTATGKTWVYLVFTVYFIYTMRNKGNEFDT